jgi:hypothetical protein
MRNCFKRIFRSIGDVGMAAYCLEAEDERAHVSYAIEL